MGSDPKSCIYFGNVRHRRFTPTQNAFRYRICLLYLNLAELPEALDPYLCWSARRPAPAWFRRTDYHGPADTDLQECVRQTVAAKLGFRPAGSICLLTHLRYWGYVFNPVSIYYCFTADGGELDAILAEVNNTPWGERHTYCLDCRTQQGQPGNFYRFQFAKEFHVSPFMPMQATYHWHLSQPGDKLSAHIADHIAGEKVFDATLTLERRELSGSTLAHALFAYPLMTMKVVAAIHWQALRLFLKKTPFHPHPKHALTGGEP
ncbi:MAG: DUF1365 domain-containing protein [Lentisphaeria bacterium]|jgi:DUF1365 family protein|nr:DUF1365 domain-containing protein [Lentisphaeria bacterium]